MLWTASAPLPRHQYVHVDGAFVGHDGAWLPAVWFGLHAHPGRVWGCTVMFEDGAVYRNLPPHALAWGEKAPAWTPGQAQLWDCYSRQFAALIYDYLDGLDAIARIEGTDVPCTYLFTAAPVGDGFTHEPAQDKEYMFLRTAHGRLTIQPTDRVRFVEASFTDPEAGWPKLKRMTESWSCEGAR